MINVYFGGNWWVNSKRFSKGAYFGQRHLAKNLRFVFFWHLFHKISFVGEMGPFLDIYIKEQRNLK